MHNIDTFLLEYPGYLGTRPKLEVVRKRAWAYHIDKLTVKSGPLLETVSFLSILHAGHL